MNEGNIKLLSLWELSTILCGITVKAIVKYVGGLVVSRRVFCWERFVIICSYSTNSDESTMQTREK